VSLAARAAAAALALSACDKIDYLPPDPVEPWPTRVLLHRGGGDPALGGSPCPQNTLPAVRFGASVVDGVEVDVQISADGTLWLGHDNEVHDCSDEAVGCFQDMGDAAIDAVAYCDEPASDASCRDASRGGQVQHYARLDDVLAAMSLELPDKLYALDIKGQYCREVGVDEANAMGDEVNRLVRLHGLDGKVAVESSQRTFLERIAANGAPVFSFVVALDDIDGPLSAAANLGAPGI